MWAAARAWILVWGLSSAVVSAADWPQWGGNNERNMASPLAGSLPDFFDPGARDSDQADLLGDSGRLVCLDEQTGRLLWQLIIPRLTNDGPSEIIGTPAVYHNKVYVTIGQDPRFGRGRGSLSCIAAGKTGDVTTGAKVWTYDRIERSLSTPSVADGKVYLGTTNRDLWVLATGKEKKVLHTIRLDSGITSTACAANGVLYVASQRYLWAVQLRQTEMGPSLPGSKGAR